jgi:hypothetical protein
LLKSGALPRAEVASLTDAGWTVVVLAFPSKPGEDVPGLTQCDRDCLKLLGQAKAPLPAERVRQELEKGGIGTYGIATVKRSLAKLRRLGLIANQMKGRRGYLLVESLPLLRRAFRA